MNMKLNRGGYVRLCDEDMQWLLSQPRSLERDHIEIIIRDSVQHYYPEPPSASAPDAGQPLMAVEQMEAYAVTAEDEGPFVPVKFLTFSDTLTSPVGFFINGQEAKFAWFDGKYYTLNHPECVHKLCKAYAAYQIQRQKNATPSTPASAARELSRQEVHAKWMEYIQRPENRMRMISTDDVARFTADLLAEQTRQLREERKRIAKAAWQVLGALFGIHVKGIYRVCNWFWDAATLDEAPLDSELFPLRDEEKNVRAKP